AGSLVAAALAGGVAHHEAHVADAVVAVLLGGGLRRARRGRGCRPRGTRAGGSLRDARRGRQRAGLDHVEVRSAPLAGQQRQRATADEDLLVLGESVDVGAADVQRGALTAQRLNVASAVDEARDADGVHDGADEVVVLDGQAVRAQRLGEGSIGAGGSSGGRPLYFVHRFNSLTRWIMPRPRVVRGRLETWLARR